MSEHHVDDSGRSNPEAVARAHELCHCGHLREAHDPCSVCKCPYFRPSEKVKAKTYPGRPTEPTSGPDRLAAPVDRRPRRDRRATTREA